MEWAGISLVSNSANVLHTYSGGLLDRRTALRTLAAPLSSGCRARHSARRFQLFAQSSPLLGAHHCAVRDSTVGTCCASSPLMIQQDRRTVTTLAQGPASFTANPSPCSAFGGECGRWERGRATTKRAHVSTRMTIHRIAQQLVTRIDQGVSSDVKGRAVVIMITGQTLTIFARRSISTRFYHSVSGVAAPYNMQPHRCRISREP